MAFYSNSSPYANTQLVDNQYLDRLNIRPIPASADDILYIVEPQYNHRPDLLAYDLYGNEKLWWVFAQRNMEIIKDPVFDLVPGIEIYVPQGPSLKESLGI